MVQLTNKKDKPHKQKSDSVSTPMHKTRRVVAIDSETYAKLRDCETEYRKHHPDLNGIHLSRAYIVKQVVEYYLNH
jgi:hypothetical protein